MASKYTVVRCEKICSFHFDLISEFKEC
ncbi:hypothetical protein Goari_006221 [Gossypium aridum]|uniref:Uncharacterized protein n=1 Tax=Gossypium aridum TaxID=34290 RepID=A0A7J8XM88_GOSAI|nr:hypothetical protein [Gossypium aridum]